MEVRHELTHVDEETKDRWEAELADRKAYWRCKTCDRHADEHPVKDGEFVRCATFVDEFCAECKHTRSAHYYSGGCIRLHPGSAPGTWRRCLCADFKDPTVHASEPRRLPSVDDERKHLARQVLLKLIFPGVCHEEVVDKALDITDEFLSRFPEDDEDEDEGED